MLKTLTDEQFNLWASLLERRAGIRISQERKSFLETNVNLRMKEILQTNIDEYYRHVTEIDTGSEWRELIDRLTVHETRFKRHESTFNLFNERIFPELTFQSGRESRVLSVGCSTGEEVYTLAMLSNQHTPASNVKICGVDISEKVIHTAKEGFYKKRALANLSNDEIEQYFTKENDGYRVINTLKRDVRFNTANVLRLEESVTDRVHVIICQNMLIYFSNEIRKTILDKFVGLLMPGGYLVLGHGESRGWVSKQVQKVNYGDTLAFRKIQK